MASPAIISAPGNFLSAWIKKYKPEGFSKGIGLQKALVKGARYLRWLREWPGLSLLN